MMLTLFGVSLILMPVLYSWNFGGRDQADFWEWLARQPLQRIIAFRVCVIVGAATTIMGLMTMIHPR